VDATGGESLIIVKAGEGHAEAIKDHDVASYADHVRFLYCDE
jgi:hypothetical protein